MSYTIAVAGARGLAGREILALLEKDETFPVERVRALGRGRMREEDTLPWRGGRIPVEPFQSPLEGVDLLFLCLPPQAAREVGLHALDSGTKVVDLSGAFQEGPLVVPELNPSALEEAEGVVRSPNCTSVILALSLYGLQKAAGLRGVLATTFQAVSGAGKAALEQLRREGAGKKAVSVLGGRIAGNVLPWVGGSSSLPGRSLEEADLAFQVPDLLGREDLVVEATCVRVPVERGHCLSVACRLEAPITREGAVEAFESVPGVEVWKEEGAPTPDQILGTQEVWIGRIRLSRALDPGILFWVAADQLVRGTALNALGLARLMLGGS